MADDVLLRTVLPNLCSVFFPLVDLLIPFSLPGTLISAIEVVPVCFRQHSVNKVGSYIFLFAVASHCGFLDTEMNNVIQVSNPCVRPIMEKPRFSVVLILLPSVPDGRKASVAYGSTPQCVSSLVVTLRQVRTECTTSCGNRRCTVVWCFWDFEGLFHLVHRVSIGL